jgi:hypothetical protein
VPTLAYIYYSISFVVLKALLKLASLYSRWAAAQKPRSRFQTPPSMLIGPESSRLACLDSTKAVPLNATVRHPSYCIRTPDETVLRSWMRVHKNASSCTVGGFFWDEAKAVIEEKPTHNGFLQDRTMSQSTARYFIDDATVSTMQ